MRLFKLAALALPVAVANAITIVGPNANAFWVQNATNTITWTFSQGDPNPINIDVINTDNQTLNGAFSIASFVNVSQETFTVTNVTLRPGSNYIVQFTNTSNATQVFANSSTFSVMPPGTSPAPSVTASTSASAASSSATSPSGSVSGSSSSTPSATGGASSGAISLSNNGGVYGVLAACGIASLSALLL